MVKNCFLKFVCFKITQPRHPLNNFVCGTFCASRDILIPEFGGKVTQNSNFDERIFSSHKILQFSNWILHHQTVSKSFVNRLGRCWLIFVNRLARCWLIFVIKFLFWGTNFPFKHFFPTLLSTYQAIRGNTCRNLQESILMVKKRFCRKTRTNHHAFQLSMFSIEKTLSKYNPKEKKKKSWLICGSDVEVSSIQPQQNFLSYSNILNLVFKTSRFLKLCRKHFLLRLWSFLCLGAQDTVHELLKVVSELFVELSTFRLKTEILTVSKVLDWNSYQLQAAFINIKMNFHIQNRRLFSDCINGPLKKVRNAARNFYGHKIFCIGLTNKILQKSKLWKICLRCKQFFKNLNFSPIWIWCEIFPWCPFSFQLGKSGNLETQKNITNLHQ